MYDLTARFYAPQIGVFGQTDPLAEFMRRWSPYVYSFSNPIRFVDRNGNAPADSTKNDVFLDPDGSEQVNLLPTVAVTAVRQHTTFWRNVVRGIWGTVDYIPLAGSMKEIGVGIYNGRCNA